MAARDPWLDRIVLGALAWTIVAGGAGMTLLAVLEVPIPPALAALSSGALGILVGWFGHHRMCRGDGPGSDAGQGK